MRTFALDKIVVAVVAIAPPLLGLAITHHWLSDTDATAFGAVLTALVAGYLTPSDEARAALATVKAIAPDLHVPDSPSLVTPVPVPAAPVELGPLPAGAVSTL